MNLVARGFNTAEPSHMTALVYLPCQCAKVQVHGMCLRRRVCALAFASCGTWPLTCALNLDSLYLYKGSSCWASVPLRVLALHVDAGDVEEEITSNILIPYYIFDCFRENATSFRTEQIFSERSKYSKHDQTVRELYLQCAISDREHGSSTDQTWSVLNKNLFSRRRWPGRAGPRT
jgi:hypothetical protein